MSIVSKAVEWAVGIASDSSHGYDQTHRWGPDYDCSSLVISAYEQAGAGVKTAGATYTGNMKNVFLSKGFKDVTSNVNRATGAGMLPGDVLLHEKNHTAMFIGNGQIVHAAGNERGGITGGTPGDQTGGEIHVRSYYNYPWDCVLRLEETATTVTDLYTVQPGDGFWVIAQRTLGDAGRWRELAAYNGLPEGHTLHPGDVIKIPNGERHEKPQAATSQKTGNVILPWLEVGVVGTTVETMQVILLHLGYALPSYGADGEFGAETKTALEQFQKESDIVETGCGPKTWAALIG